MRYIYLMRILLTLLFIALTATPSLAQEVSEDKSAARILAYFMVGEDNNPDASVRLDVFESHLQTLKNESAPMALPNIIDAWEKGTSLPNKTTAITFDGGHRSVLTHALPLLTKYNIPFTVFVASDLADIGAPQYLGWNDIKKLQKTGLATIGMHTASYNSFLYTNSFAQSLNKARARFREQLGTIPTLFSFPFGAYNDEAQTLIQEQNFLSVGQHSGVAYTGQSVLPRFTMNEYFSDETRLNMIINALPLPVSDKSPEATMRSTPRDSITAYGFTAIHGNTGINCYSSDEDITLEMVNDHRVEIRTSMHMEDSRLRINCTQKTNDNQIRWMGFLAVR